jgi:hypothetical protein
MTSSQESTERDQHPSLCLELVTVLQVPLVGLWWSEFSPSPRGSQVESPAAVSLFLSSLLPPPRPLSLSLSTGDETQDFMLDKHCTTPNYTYIPRPRLLLLLIA